MTWPEWRNNAQITNSSRVVIWNSSCIVFFLQMQLLYSNWNVTEIRKSHKISYISASPLFENNILCKLNNNLDTGYIIFLAVYLRNAFWILYSAVIVSCPYKARKYSYIPEINSLTMFKAFLAYFQSLVRR